MTFRSTLIWQLLDPCLSLTALAFLYNSRLPLSPSLNRAVFTWDCLLLMSFGLIFLSLVETVQEKACPSQSIPDTGPSARPLFCNTSFDLQSRWFVLLCCMHGYNFFTLLLISNLETYFRIKQIPCFLSKLLFQDLASFNNSSQKQFYLTSCRNDHS